MHSAHSQASELTALQQRRHRMLRKLVTLGPQLTVPMQCQKCTCCRAGATRTCAHECLRLQYADANAPEVAVRDASELSYEEFVVHYMAPNVPVVITVRQH